MPLWTAPWLATASSSHADRRRSYWSVDVVVLPGLVWSVVLAWAMVLAKQGDWDGVIHRTAVSESLDHNSTRKRNWLANYCSIFRVLRGVLFVLSGLEYWYENTEDRLLSEERRRLLPY